MIVACRDDVVQLSGSLHKNQWLTIKAAARLLLQQHPQGILIDCSELTDISEDGAKTFLEAMKDIQGEGARIIVVSLPEQVMEVIRSVPGVRSQLPIARTLEEARASFRLGGKSGIVSADGVISENSILVPLIPGLDVEYAVSVAARIAREQRANLALAALLVVTRNRPLGTPMPEEEEQATALLGQAEQAARRTNTPIVRHVERVRDAEEGVLQLIKTYKASHVVLAVHADRVTDEPFLKIVEILLHRAPCHVLIARRAPDVEHPLEATVGASFGHREEE
jgi:anti-anti-sigma regulatory factor